MTAPPLLAESPLQIERFEGNWDEFWALLAESELNEDFDYEFEDGIILRTMSHEADYHSSVANRLGFLFESIFDAPDYLVFNSNRPLFIPALNRVYNPDSMVVRLPRELYEYRPGMTAEMTPFLFLEILSPSSRRHDFKRKLPAYQQIPSLRFILLVEVEHPMVYFYVRQTDDSWSLNLFDQLDQSFEINGQPVSLRGIYKRISFDI